jgi:5-(carboxyamino)imidazole ribonucleotide synthase
VNDPLLPGATIGIIGGGQLGQMTAMEARRLGYRVAIMDPDPDCPARRWSDDYEQGALGDAAAAVRLAARCDVLTIETEHIPAEVLAAAEQTRPVHPSSAVMRTVQDRLAQKTFLAKHGFPTAAFSAVDDEATLKAALTKVGTPAMLKARRGGYDGRGQARITKSDEAKAAWNSLGKKPAILEEMIPFDAEVSVVLARGDGETACYPLARNLHIGGVLHTTCVPAEVQPGIENAASGLATRIADALELRGMLAVEMFLHDGQLLVNELAPRPHNSGHFTFGACRTSQFEQHARSICGLPLGDPALLSPVTMLNLLGDLWGQGEPDWPRVLAEPRARLHLYGKRDARSGRKMGHLLIIDKDGNEAFAVAERLHASLSAAARVSPQKANA